MMRTLAAVAVLLAAILLGAAILLAAPPTFDLYFAGRPVARAQGPALVLAVFTAGALFVLAFDQLLDRLRDLLTDDEGNRRGLALVLAVWFATLAATAAMRLLSPAAAVIIALSGAGALYFGHELLRRLQADEAPALEGHWGGLGGGLGGWRLSPATTALVMVLACAAAGVTAAAWKPPAPAAPALHRAPLIAWIPTPATIVAPPSASGLGQAGAGTQAVPRANVAPPIAATLP